MMQTARLRWIGETRKSALRDAVVSRCVAWRSLWAIGGDAFAVDAEPLREDRTEQHPFDPRWHVMSTRDGNCYVHASSATFDRLGKALAATTATDASGIALGIGKRSLTDLVARLHAEPASEGLAALPGMPEARAIDRRYGAFGCQLRLGSVAIELYMDAALCDALAPPQAAQSEALQTRTAAIRPLQATFDAVLDLGNASIRDSLALRPGEIVRTTIPIDAPVRLRAGSGADALIGTLVAANGRRALRIAESIQSPEATS